MYVLKIEKILLKSLPRLMMKMMTLLGSVFVRLIRMLRFRSCLNMKKNQII